MVSTLDRTIQILRELPERQPDMFYSEGNMRYLEQKMKDYKAGRLHFAEHELIEDEPYR